MNDANIIGCILLFRNHSCHRGLMVEVCISDLGFIAFLGCEILDIFGRQAWLEAKAIYERTL
jgi:hypothetical protein